MNNARYKRSYFQSHLLGVPELFIGYHTNNLLCRTELLRVADLPSKITIPQWNPQIDLDRGYAVLNAIKKDCSNKLARCTYDNRISDHKVWRVDVHNGETQIQELTAQEANCLGESGTRTGIVPNQVIEELRRVTKEMPSVK